MLLGGEVEPRWPDKPYPLVRAAAGDRCVISVHGGVVVPLDLAARRRVEPVNGPAHAVLTRAVGGGPAEVAPVIHAPDGRIIESASAPLGEGPHTPDVPRGGLAPLTVTEGRR